MRRSTAGAVAAALGAAGTVAALTVGTSTGTAAPATSEAFGVSATGLVDIPKTPHVTSDDGTLQEESLLNVPLGEFGEIRVATMKAGDNVASAELAGVELGNEVGSISAKVLEVACEGDKGTVKIVDLDLNGQQVVLPPADQNPVNQVIEVPGVAKITYNKQTTNPDGSFTVVGLEVDLIGSTQVVTLGSATCADAKDGGADDGGADDGGADDGGADGGADDGGDPSATKPAPITTGLPVTG